MPKCMKANEDLKEIGNDLTNTKNGDTNYREADIR